MPIVARLCQDNTQNLSRRSSAAPHTSRSKWSLGSIISQHKGQTHSHLCVLLCTNVTLGQKKIIVCKREDLCLSLPSTVLTIGITARSLGLFERGHYRRAIHTSEKVRRYSALLPPRARKMMHAGSRNQINPSKVLARDSTLRLNAGRQTHRSDESESAEPF
jgi:hypothetical protein